MEATQFERILKIVAESGADVVSIGGVAMILMGGEHFTQDVDFAFSRRKETLSAIVSALAPFHPRPVEWPEDAPFTWDEQTVRNMSTLTLMTDIGRIDFLAEPDGAPAYDVLRSNASPVDLDGVTLYVASIDDLISMKRAAGRPKDLAHIAELETIKSLMQETGGNG